MTHGHAVVAVDLFRGFGATGEFETTQRYGPRDARFGAVGTDVFARPSGFRWPPKLSPWIGLAF